MKRFLFPLILFAVGTTLGQNMLIKREPIYIGIRSAEVQNSNSSWTSVLTQQGGLNITFTASFNNETVDSMRLVVGLKTSEAGTHEVRFRNKIGSVTPTIINTVSVSGIVAGQYTGSWLRITSTVLDTFKLEARSLTTSGDISVYYAAYETKRISLPSGAGGVGTIQESDATVGTDANTLDFGQGFDVTESPADEFNIVPDYGEDPPDLSTSDITGKLPLGNIATIADGTFLGNNTGGVVSAIAMTVAQAKTLLSLTGTNSGDITLAGSPDYITLSGQVVTRALVSLTSHITGTLPFGNGGFGFATATAGDMFYIAGGVPTKLAAGTTAHFLQGGTTPSWANRTVPTVTTSWVPYFPTTTTMADAFFWENTNKTIGIGIATGLETDAAIHAVRNSGVNYFYISAYAANTGLISKPYGGSVGTPAGVASGQSMLVLGTRPYNGTAFPATPSVSIQFNATQLHTATALGGKLKFGVTANNSTTQVFPVEFTDNGLEIMAGYNMRVYDADASNVGIFTVPGLASNLTYTAANASGDIATLSANGFAVRTASQTWASRSIVAPAAGFTITAGNGVAGDPTFVLANDLAALEAISTTGIMVRSASETYLVRSIANATAGLTWTNGDGIAGNPTPVLANDLLGVEGLGANGMATRTATDTWAVRTVTGTAEEITVTNGDGVAGNPTLSIPDVFKIIELPAGFFNPAAGDLTGATALANDADNTNDWTLDQLEFSASAENYLSGHVMMPEDWDGSTAPKFKIVYYSGTGHASNVVEWDISARYLRHGTDSWVAAQGTAATTTHNPTTANIWYETSALQPTPAGTAAIGATLQIRIWRDGDDASDTHTATARLVKVLMSYKKVQYGETTDW